MLCKEASQNWASRHLPTRLSQLISMAAQIEKQQNNGKEKSTRHRSKAQQEQRNTTVRGRHEGPD
jgi:hypothetical protein